MKYLFAAALIFFSILSFGQFNCMDGEVWSCNGFVDDSNIYGNLDFSDNSLSTYTCGGTTIGSSLGTGLNDLYGQDDIYIFNSIGESGAFNSMTVTLTMNSNTDLDMIAISPDCSYNCFASDSYAVSGAGVTETFTLEWEDEQTIILIVEAYHLDGGGEYQLNFQYNNLYNFCSYFPYEGIPITCSPSNQYSGSLSPVNCLTSFPTDCPPEMTYHQGEGPFFANEHVYSITPEANSGVINIDLSLSGGMKAYLYHKYFVGIDLTPIDLIGSSSSFISASYTLNGFDEFFLIIDGPDQGVYPYSFSINFPGCNPIDECGVHF